MADPRALSAYPGNLPANMLTNSTQTKAIDKNLLRVNIQGVNLSGSFTNYLRINIGYNGAYFVVRRNIKAKVNSIFTRKQRWIPSILNKRDMVKQEI